MTTATLTIPKAVETLARLAAMSVVFTGMNVESALEVAINAQRNGARDVWRRYGADTFPRWLADQWDWALTLSVAQDAEEGTERSSVGNVREAVLALVPGYADELRERRNA